MTAFAIILVAILGAIGIMEVTSAIVKYRQKRRDTQFLRMIRIIMPDAKVVEIISVASSDKDAMANVERRLRDASRTL
jgi:hypothetical protein